MNIFDAIIACGAQERLDIAKAMDSEIEKAEGSRGGKVIGHTATGKPIYENKNDPHQFMGVHSRNDNHGKESRKVTNAVRKMSDEELDKFHKHHEEHGKHWISHSEESKARAEKDKKENERTSDGWTDQSDDDMSHYEAADAAKREKRRRESSGESEKDRRRDERRDRNTPV